MESDGWKLVQVGEEKHFMKGLGRFSRDGWHRRLLLGQPGPCAPARPKNPRYSGRPARATCLFRAGARLFTTAIVQWREGYAIIDIRRLPYTRAQWWPSITCTAHTTAPTSLMALPLQQVGIAVANC